MEVDEQSEIINKLNAIENHLSNLDGRIERLEGEQQPVRVATTETVGIPAPTTPEQPIATTASDESEMELIRQKALAATPVPTPGTAAGSTPEKRDFEAELGQKWFSRLGITALVIGIALFLIYTLQYFNAVGKVSVGLLSAGALLGAGSWLEGKYKLFGQVLFGGGVALAYFTTYAMYYFDTTKLITNEYVDISILMIIAIGYFAYVYTKYRNEKMTLIPLTLVFLTVNLGEIAQFSLVMVTIFMTAALAIFWVSKWKYGYVFMMLAAYLTYMRWLVPNIGGGPAEFGTLLFSLTILTIFYLFFVVSHYFFYHKEELATKTENIGLVAINSIAYFAFFSILIRSTYQDPHGVLWILFAFLNLAIAAIIRFIVKAKYMSRAYLSISVVLFFGWVPMALTGFNIVFMWLLLALVFAAYGLLRGTIRTRAVGMVLLGFVFAYLLTHFDLDTDKNAVGMMSIVYFFVLEGLSLLQQKYEVKREVSDDPKTDASLNAFYSIASVVALATGLFKVVDYNYISLVWGIAGFFVAIVGFGINDRYFRRAGLGLLLFVFLKLFLFDLGNMDMIFRIISFIVLGVILLVLSFGYTKYKDEVKRYL